MSRVLPEPEALAAAVSGRDRLALAQALNLLDDRRPVFVFPGDYRFVAGPFTPA